MKNKITIAIILGIFFLVSVNAMYAGECEQFDLSGLESLDNIVYTSVGNQYDLEGLNITLNGTNVDICPSLDYRPDNFTLIFWDDSPEEVIKEVIVYRRGRTKTKIIYENITEYIDVEKIVYVNEIINETLDCEEIDIPEEEKGFFKKIWNWIKNLFVNKD